MVTTINIIGTPPHKTRMVVCMEDSCIFKKDSIKLELKENSNGILRLKCPNCGDEQILVRKNWDLHIYNN